MFSDCLNFGKLCSVGYSYRVFSINARLFRSFWGAEFCSSRHDPIAVVIVIQCATFH